MLIESPDIENSQIGIRGDLHIVEYEILTDEDGNVILDENKKPMRGKVVGELDEKNIVLTQGKSLILQAFGQPGNSAFVVKTIKIGNDTGTGTILLPTPPTAGMTEADQSVVYTTPDEEFFVTFPTPTSVRFLATINGANVMAEYPSLPNVIYTSASIYTISDQSITYKRFPARTISELISVDITWTITLT